MQDERGLSKSKKKPVFFTSQFYVHIIVLQVCSP